MPSPPTPSRRFSVTTIAGLTAIAAWCIRTSIQHSEQPEAYYGYFRHPSAFEFPIRDVIEWISVIAAETSLASWLVWRTRSARAMSMALALVLAVGVVVLAPFTMHGPPYLVAHLVFLMFAALWLALAAIVGWIAQSVSNARERAHRQRDGDLPPPAIAVTKKSQAAR